MNINLDCRSPSRAGSFIILDAVWSGAGAKL